MIKNRILLLALIIAPAAYAMDAEARKEKQERELMATVEQHGPMYPEKTLCFLVLTEKPEAATAIAAQIQAKQQSLSDETVKPKQKEKLEDNIKWLRWLEKVANK